MRVCVYTLVSGFRALCIRVISLNDLSTYVCVRVRYVHDRAAGTFVQVGCRRCLTTSSAAGPVGYIHTVWQ